MFLSRGYFCEKNKDVSRKCGYFDEDKDQLKSRQTQGSLEYILFSIKRAFALNHTMSDIYDFANLCRNWIEFDTFVAKIPELLVGLFANVISTSTPCKKFIVTKTRITLNKSFGQKFVWQKYSSDKIDEILAWWRKSCPTKNFVWQQFCRTNFHPIR